MPLDRKGFLMTQQMGQISQPHRQVVDRYPCKGWALFFLDHSDEYFYVPDDDAFNWDEDFTVGFWFKNFGWNDPEAIENRYIISCSPAAKPGWGIYLKHFAGTYSIHARMFNSGVGVISDELYSGLMPWGRRYCVLVSFSESAGDVIVKKFLGDGTGAVLCNTSTTFSDITLAGEDDGEDLWLGRQSDVVTNVVNADMDEIHIWTSDVFAAIRVAWFNGGSGTKLEALGTPEAGYHCDWSVVDFMVNGHNLVRGPRGRYISPDLIHSPGCDINGER